MATEKKMLQAAAGNAGGAGLDVDEVFSTYLYTGDGSSTARAFENGIDLAGEGGLVWTKGRSNADQNALVDTERMNGGRMSKVLNSDSTSNAVDYYNYGIEVMTPSSTGYDLKNSELLFNGSSRTYASWTFRKAPKFFDVVTFEITRDGSNNLSSTSSNVTISNGEVTVDHNLASPPAIWMQKNADSSSAWYVRSTISGTVGGYGQLNRTNAWAGVGNWTFASTDTQVGLGNYGFFQSGTNTYVMYLFANNAGDGEFGPDGDQDIIKCGSYTGNGFSTGPVINLGFEPQWLLIKNASASANWELVDNMRDFRSPKTNVGLQALNPNSSDPESEGRAFGATATGFSIVDDHADVNASGNKYIYMAIRRGSLFPPESATEVFALQQDNFDSNAPAFRSDFPVDFAIEKKITSATLNNSIVPRLTAPLYLETDTLVVENSDAEYAFDYNNGWNSQPNQGSNLIAYMWKRAPNFCDVVAYKGNGVAGHSITHNLGVAPEMIWVKNRGTTNKSWNAYLGPLGLSGGAPAYAVLNETDAAAYSTTRFYTTPTATEFSVGSNSRVNTSGDDYIAYLFASLPGISKVGSYTGDDTNGRVIDCGFTTGARFIIIKRTNLIGNWNLWDSVRGIVTGNDPYIELDNTAAEVTTTDYVDPHASGFIVNFHAKMNKSGNTYIFYAIA